MKGKVGFVLPKEAFGAPTGGGVAERGEDALRNAGVRFAFSEQPDEYRFSRMGGWPVPFRSSITRVRTALAQPLSVIFTGWLSDSALLRQVITFKLVGTGIAAFLMANNPHTGRFTAFSCALCAAVNAIATVHYVLICRRPRL
jgi:hypothetical protein